SVDLEEAGSIKSYSKTQLISSLAVEPTQDTTISFTSTVYDRADNELPVSDSSITYDNDAPIISYLTLAFTDNNTIVSDGIVVDGGTTYINGYANDTDTDISLSVNDGSGGTSLSDLDDNFRGYQYTFGSFTGSETSADDISADSIDYSTYSADALQGSNTLTLRVYDEAGNYDEKTIGFTLDTEKESAIDSITGIDTDEVVITFKDAYPGGSSITLADSLPQNKTPVLSSGNTVYTYTTTTYVFNEQSYVISDDIYPDTAGNPNYTDYTLTSTGANADSGLSTPIMTLQPDLIPDTTPTSYKSVRTYDYSSSNSIRAEEGEQFVSADMSEISSHEKASAFMAYPVSYRRGSAAVDIPVPDRIIEDLDTSDTVLKGAMDEIAFNEAEYEAQLQSLMTPKLSRARLKDMVNALEPVIVEPETITVSATPFLMGAATEIQVVVGTESEISEKTSGALLIQIMGVLLMALLSIGFVMVLKKMSKT
ncbi:MULTISPECIES: hypothetical protein, partial [unclassified Oceanispirochaeta]|uniref:hypothetical protein n=1 Tax=unclassified Oceanispirochaeta TaxID=2635722 RepID=UPI000E15EC20